MFMKVAPHVLGLWIVFIAFTFEGNSILVPPIPSVGAPWHGHAIRARSECLAQAFWVLENNVAAAIFPPSPTGAIFAICGLNYTAWSAEAYALPASDASLSRLASLGANYVALLVTGYMEDHSSTEIYLDPHLTPSDRALGHAIRVAHSLGLKVMLKPHVDLRSGGWRGHITPRDPLIWFQRYADFILRYARLAQDYNVELFCVGTELRSLSTAKFRLYWKEVILTVRRSFRGGLVYAANWDEYPFVDFWDLLDYAGIDAYFPLSSSRTPTVTELIEAWKPWIAALEGWQAEVGKPVIFTEIGYRSVDYAAREPWNWTARAPYNPEAQANCFEAVFLALQGKPWFAGVFFWNWLPDPNAGGAGDLDYTPQNKPAEAVLARFFQGRLSYPAMGSSSARFPDSPNELRNVHGQQAECIRTPLRNAKGGGAGEKARGRSTGTMRNLRDKGGAAYAG
ncbi:MAG: hypothetical protein ABDI20_06270 [Candidatus Bipolaricaulaceae bacterium]